MIYSRLLHCSQFTKQQSQNQRSEQTGCIGPHRYGKSTFYELVTGEVPDTVELEKLPAWLRPVIQRCIKNKPEERYFSAEELGEPGGMRDYKHSDFVKLNIIGINCILHPTDLPWSGRQHEPMPLRWSLADPVASVAINMPFQKELFASSRLPRRRVQDACKEQAALLRRFFRGALVHPAALSPIKRPIRLKRYQPLIPRGIKSSAPASAF